MKDVLLNSMEKMPIVGLGVFRCSEEEAYNAVKTALEIGYRHIDTATAYGNEEAVGNAIKDSGIPREELFITTKLWNEDMRQHRERAAFEDSLKKLGLDYLDMYLIHWPVKGCYLQSWEELRKIYEEGLSKSVGVSNFLKHHLVELERESELYPAVDQMEFHPYLVQKELLDYCKKQMIQYEAYSPLCANKNSLLQEKTLVDLAEKYGKSPAQIVLRWDIEHNVVTIPKSVHKERLQENIDIFDFELSAEDISKIDAMDTNTRFASDPDNFDF